MTVLWIEERALCELNAEACRAFPQETGGVLVGYVANGQQPVVVTVIGPGPAAVHQRSRFQPDHQWQCEQLDDIYEHSSGKFVYLGDWHTHPDGSPQMSWLDRRTIRNIAKHAPARCSQPLMLIGGGAPETWHWLVHRYLGDRLLGIKVDSEELGLRTYMMAT